LDKRSGRQLAACRTLVERDGPPNNYDAPEISISTTECAEYNNHVPAKGSEYTKRYFISHCRRGGLASWDAVIRPCRLSCRHLSSRRRFTTAPAALLCGTICGKIRTAFYLNIHPLICRSDTNLLDQNMFHHCRSVNVLERLCLPVHSIFYFCAAKQSGCCPPIYWTGVLPTHLLDHPR